MCYKRGYRHVGEVKGLAQGHTAMLDWNQTLWVSKALELTATQSAEFRCVRTEWVCRKKGREGKGIIYGELEGNVHKHKALGKRVFSSLLTAILR